MKDFAARADQKRLAGDAHAAVEIAEAGLLENPTNDRGRMALALALMDIGDIPRAKEQLAVAFPVEIASLETPPPLSLETPPPLSLETPPPLPGARAEETSDDPLADSLGDDELELAFENAETNPDEMMSANRLVEQTLENEHDEAPEVGFDVVDSPTYATETMASLLEGQGRARDAKVVRSAIPLDADLVDVDDENESTQERLAAPSLLDAAEAMPTDGSEWAGANIGPEHSHRVRVVTTLEGWLHNLRQTRESRELRGKAGGST